MDNSVTVSKETGFNMFAKTTYITHNKKNMFNGQSKVYENCKKIGHHSDKKSEQTNLNKSLQKDGITHNDGNHQNIQLLMMI